MRTYRAPQRPPSPARTVPFPHATRREGDEMACRCGKRWPVGESHP